MNAPLDDIDRRLLNDFQHDFPLTSAPYADVARELGVSETEVLARLKALRQAGAVSRVGAVVRPKRIGSSTLAAMAVSATRLDEVAALVSGFSEVNHNYEREHDYNLWFVVTAASQARVDAVLHEIEARTGLQVLRLPMLADYHIDLGFRMQWT